jgi:hypothetical protein
MRLVPLALLLMLVTGCEQYTDKRSPCFTPGGRPVVSQDAWRPATLALSTKGSGGCVFVDLDAE